MTTGELIRAARQAKGLTARRLSLDAHLSESYVGKLEKDQVEPSLKAFANIANALHMNQTEICFVVTNAVR